MTINIDPSMKYRPDIDGLRSLAIISVLIFHGFPDLLKGGFIGVDIFFVISGYLISHNIFRNFENNSFSFIDFYSRRIIRIFPALIIILFTCCIAGWLVLYPDEYKQLGLHILGGSTFTSNFLLWFESGYFDSTSELKPLLHLWSLGIEEQFYIFWPILLLVLRKNIGVLSTCLIVGFISLYFCITTVIIDPTKAFYAPHTRFWELMTGSILAWITIHKLPIFFNLHRSKISFLEDSNQFHKILLNSLSFFGLLVLAYGVWRINRNTTYPGTWTLLPVLGTALIIMSGAQAWVNKAILSNKIIVWFGLISFPLYLWHWPLLSFSHILAGQIPSTAIRILVLLVSIALAWLTYSFVERPFRQKKYRKEKTFFLLSLMITFAVLGCVIFTNDGIKTRSTDEREKSYEKNLTTAIKNCEIFFPDWMKLNDNPCMLQNKNGNDLAIIGDSHASHLYPGISELTENGAGVAVFSASCAAPYINISSATSDPNAKKIRENSYKLINSAYEFILNDPLIKTVILAHNPTCSFRDVKDMANPTTSNPDDIFENGMRRTFSALAYANKNVIILLDNPPLPFDPSSCNSRPFGYAKSNEKCSFPRSDFDSREDFSNYNSHVRRVIKDYPNIKAYDLSHIFCDDKNCYIKKNGQPLYKDRNHLSFYGSRYVAPYIMKSTQAFAK